MSKQYGRYFENCYLIKVNEIKNRKMMTKFIFKLLYIIIIFLKYKDPEKLIFAVIFISYKYDIFEIRLNNFFFIITFI